MTHLEDGRGKYTLVGLISLSIIGLAAAGYLYSGILKEVDSNIDYLSGAATEARDQNFFVLQQLNNEKQKNNAFSSQIGDITKTIGRLDQLSKTDKELLQKYSKIFFLNENYAPKSLIDIPPDYIWEEGKKIQMLTEAYPFLQQMIVDAQKDGVNIKIISAYRSFGQQSALKGNYLVTYGSGANKFSADQGYSEHQLGTALDLTTEELGAGYTSFEKSDAYEWLNNNAYKYGFIISYPKGNSYYQYEPWHWRFVGRALARMLHEEKVNFYDVEQRTIDNYLIKLFD